MLAVFPDLNIFVFSITIFDLISRSALVRFILLRARYLYNYTGLRFYILCSKPASSLCDRHRHGLVHFIDTTKITVLMFVWYCLVFIQLILKICFCLTCINTQKWAIEPFDDTPVISSNNHKKTGLYQGSADRCEVDRNSAIIFLLQQYQAIHYCNQSVLAIFPDLNIFVFSITIVDLISRTALVWL